MQPLPAALWPQLAALETGESLRGCFDAASNPKSTPESLGAELDQNQAYAHLVQSLDIFVQRLKKWEDDLALQLADVKKPEGEGEQKTEKPRPVPLESHKFIDTVGKTQTRNIISAVAVLRAGGAGLPRTPKERSTLSPAKLIRFAIKAEEVAEDARMASPEMAFAGGLHYDFLIGAATQDKPAAKEVAAQCEALFADALRIGNAAYRISSLFKDLEHARFSFAAGLILPLGKAWMCRLYPKIEGSPAISYKEYSAPISKMGKLARVYLHVTESKKFAINHAELSALAANAMGFLRPVERAISLYQEPEKLLGEDKSLYQFACILNAATSLATLDPSAIKNLEKAPLSVSDQRHLEKLGIPLSKISGILGG